MSDFRSDEKTILIVDDEQDILKVLSYGLEALGFSVITADNGSDAIISAVQQQPDLVILDVIMPGMDGGEVARKLKELTETKYIPIVFLTGMFPKRGHCKDFHMVNGNIMLDKPYEIGEIFVVIKKLLGENVLS